MTPPLSRDLRSPCGLPAARLSGKLKQKDSENGKALKNRGLRGSKRIYRNFVAVLPNFSRSTFPSSGEKCGLSGLILVATPDAVALNALSVLDTVRGRADSRLLVAFIAPHPSIADPRPAAGAL